MASVEQKLIDEGMNTVTRDRCIIVSEKNKLVYVNNPKVACTTIKKFIYCAAAIDQGDFEFEEKLKQTETFSVHFFSMMPLPNFTTLDADTRSAALNSDEYLRFSFVRHPAARVLSCYLDKIEPIFDKPITRPRILLNEEFGLDPSEHMTFEQFLDLVALQNPKKRNPHWREQTRNLHPSIIPYSFIGRLEEFDKDFSKVSSVIPLDQHTSVKKLNKTDTENRMREYLSELASAKIAEIYESDFDAFGYDRATPVV